MNLTLEQLFNYGDEQMNEDNTASEFMHAQSDIIEKVNESMPDEEILYDLA